jgi:hypothetical protein
VSNSSTTLSWAICYSSLAGGSLPTPTGFSTAGYASRRFCVQNTRCGVETAHPALTFSKHQDRVLARNASVIQVANSFLLPQSTVDMPVSPVIAGPVSRGNTLISLARWPPTTSLEETVHFLFLSTFFYHE